MALKERVEMRQNWIAALMVFLLGVSWGWAQQAPSHRKHTRPPYSGPHKANKVRLKARPMARAGKRSKPGVFHPAAPKSDHGIAH